MNGRADNLQSHSIASLLPGTYNNLVLTTIENALHFFFEKIFRNIKQLHWHAVTIVHVIKITPSSRMAPEKILIQIAAAGYAYRR